MSSVRPNILWIVIDSLRADHTSLHGYHRDTTPELSRIATSGEKFEHGIAHSTRTAISIPSMLTGLYPSRHRMIGAETTARLSEEMKTAPELLSDRGYRTLGISENGFAGAAKGIDERFDTFVKSSPSSIKDLLTSDLGLSFVKYAFNTRAHGPGLTLDVHAHGKQSSYFTLDITERKLRQISKNDDPFFCYVHFNDTHHPYVPPLLYRDEYTNEINCSADEAVALALRMSNNMWEWMASEIPLSEREWGMIYAMYDATIKYVDACVGRLFDFVQDRFESTIVVVTADHGELFGEYGLLDHHTVLHDALIHVPLITYGMDDVSHHTDKPTQHIDVMQTLLSLAGADISQFQGYDLRNQTREIAVSQALHESVDDPDRENYDRIRQYNPDIDLSHLPQSLTTCARTTDFKLVQTDEWRTLYKLPDERTDVRDEHLSEYENLTAFLDSWLESDGEPLDVAPEEANVSDAMEKHLRDMGYLGVVL